MTPLELILIILSALLEFLCWNGVDGREGERSGGEGSGGEGRVRGMIDKGAYVLRIGAN